jgi:prevent-host-death family protein
MQVVNMLEAKNQLSKLVQRAENGEDILIARAGKPAARLTQADETNQRPRIRFGTQKGKIWIADDFDAPLPADFLSTGHPESEL